jgi:hypothetical protein
MGRPPIPEKEIKASKAPQEVNVSDAKPDVKKIAAVSAYYSAYSEGRHARLRVFLP